MLSLIRLLTQFAVLNLTVKMEMRPFVTSFHNYSTNEDFRDFLKHNIPKQSFFKMFLKSPIYSHVEYKRFMVTTQSFN
jgi:aminopeptidase-like protein